MPEAVSDLKDGLKLWELWSTLGWHDIRQRYRRSVVGPLWLTLSMGVMVSGLAFLYSGFFGQSTKNYLPYVATGMIVFSLISTIASEGATVFISSSASILQMRAPLSIYIYQMLWRNIIIFCHNLSIYIIVLIFGDVPIGWTMMLAILGLAIIVINGVWVGMILGCLSARFRDIPPIVASVMQVAFFLTPIFWLPQSIPSRAYFVHLNPFFYLVEIVRMPLLDQVPPFSIYLVAFGMTGIGAVLSALFFSRYRRRIAYWV